MSASLAAAMTARLAILAVGAEKSLSEEHADRHRGDEAAFVPHRRDYGVPGERRERGWRNYKRRSEVRGRRSERGRRAAATEVISGV